MFNKLRRLFTQFLHKKKFLPILKTDAEIRSHYYIFVDGGREYMLKYRFNPKKTEIVIKFKKSRAVYNAHTSLISTVRKPRFLRQRLSLPIYPPHRSRFPPLANQHDFQSEGRNRPNKSPK